MTKKRVTITVLTKPIDYPYQLIKKFFINFAKQIICFLLMRSFPKRINYRGDSSVTRSLLNGLKALNIAFNSNPLFKSQLGEICHVLSDPNALSQAIKFKKNKMIECLVAGPNIVTVPSDHGGIICDPEIDFILVPSDWVKDLYIKIEPSLRDRICVWPSGIDLENWNGSKTVCRKPKNVLVYNKNFYDPIILQECTERLKNKGLSLNHIVYGKYSIDEYQSALQHSDFMIFFGSTESQGIALLESWVSNVPTFVLTRNLWECKGVYYNASSAPYLHDSTGHFFDDCDQLEFYIDNWQKFSDSYAPRAWVEKNLTDEKSVLNLMQIINRGVKF